MHKLLAILSLLTLRRCRIAFYVLFGEFISNDEGILGLTSRQPDL